MVIKKKEAVSRIQATGSRKTSTARVFLSPGKGVITINKKTLTDYFPLAVDRYCLMQPLAIATLEDGCDLFITVTGGGKNGQLEAIRHGISKAVVQFKPEARDPIKHKGFLTRDARRVERKKYGLRKARKAAPFVKR